MSTHGYCSAQTSFSVGMKGVLPHNVAAVEALIHDELQRLAR
jgi:hypothetical protein